MKQIVKEICGYVEGLELNYKNPFSGSVVDSVKRKYGKQVIYEDVDFAEGISSRPFKVNGIYVIGGQVEYLPDSYNTGEHDMDMIVKTNAGIVTFSKRLEAAIVNNLADILEDGKGCWSERDKKEFALDIFHDKVEKPYVQIYPDIKKVE